MSSALTAKARGTVIALVDGAHYRGPMCVSCSHCKWQRARRPADRVLRPEIGGTHHMAGRAVGVGERLR